MPIIFSNKFSGHTTAQPPATKSTELHKAQRNVPKLAHPYPRLEVTAQQLWILCNNSQ